MKDFSDLTKAHYYGQSNQNYLSTTVAALLRIMCSYLLAFVVGGGKKFSTKRFLLRLFCVVAERPWHQLESQNFVSGCCMQVEKACSFVDVVGVASNFFISKIVTLERIMEVR